MNPQHPFPVCGGSQHSSPHFPSRVTGPFIVTPFPAPGVPHSKIPSVQLSHCLLATGPPLRHLLLHSGVGGQAVRQEPSALAGCTAGRTAAGRRLVRCDAAALGVRVFDAAAAQQLASGARSVHHNVRKGGGPRRPVGRWVGSWLALYITTSARWGGGE